MELILVNDGPILKSRWAVDGEPIMFISVATDGSHGAAFLRVPFLVSVFIRSACRGSAERDQGCE